MLYVYADFITFSSFYYYGFFTSFCLSLSPSLFLSSLSLFLNNFIVSVHCCSRDISNTREIISYDQLCIDRTALDSIFELFQYIFGIFFSINVDLTTEMRLVQLLFEYISFVCVVCFQILSSCLEIESL